MTPWHLVNVFKISEISSFCRTRPSWNSTHGVIPEKLNLHVTVGVMSRLRWNATFYPILVDYLKLALLAMLYDLPIPPPSGTSTPMGSGPHRASWWHSDTPHSVGLLWASHQLIAETSSWLHKTEETYPCSLAGFEPGILASEWPHIHALDRASTGIGNIDYNIYNILCYIIMLYIIFFCGAAAHAGHGLLFLEVSRSHTTTHHSR